MTERKVPKHGKRQWVKVTLVALAAIFAGMILLRIVAGYVMERSFNAKLAELRERGEPVTLAEMAPPPVPSERNAATYYERAFQKLESLGKEDLTNFGQLTAKDGALSAEEVRKAMDLLDHARPAMSMLHKAVECDECRYPIDYQSPGHLLRLPHLQKLRILVRLLKLSSNANLEWRYGGTAAEDCVIALKVAQSAEQDPTPVSLLVESGLMGLVLVQLERVMDRAEPSASQLTRIERLLSSEADRRRFTRVLRGERCTGLSLINLTLHDPNKLLKFLIARRPSVVLRALVRVGVFVYKPIILMDACHYLDIMDRFIWLSESPYGVSWDGWRSLNEDIEEIAGGRYIRHPMLQMLVPSLRQVAAVYDSTVAWKGCSRIAITLRLCRMKSGQYPEGLPKLVPEFLDKLPIDPFSGKDFIYRREGNGFIVYSVGPNRKDDGGKEPVRDSETEDIVWKCSR